MGISTSRLRRGGKKVRTPQTDEEIEYACKIEEVQSAVYRTVGEMVAKYGREVVADSLEWIVDKLKPPKKDTNERVQKDQPAT